MNSPNIFTDLAKKSKEMCTRIPPMFYSLSVFVTLKQLNEKQRLNKSHVKITPVTPSQNQKSRSRQSLLWKKIRLGLFLFHANSFRVFLVTATWEGGGSNKILMGQLPNRWTKEGNKRRQKAEVYSDVSYFCFSHLKWDNWVCEGRWWQELSAWICKWILPSE